MTNKILMAISVALGLCLAANNSLAATVPAGATLIVRTLETISSTDVVGTPFTAQLQANVANNGKVLLPAGTKVSGKIVTSRRSVSSNDRLTVDLISVQFGGRAHPVKTTGAVLLDNQNFKSTRTRTPVSRGSYSVAAGRAMQFHLAQPLNL